ncbi:LPS export ABC transporter periplasmic protein LptC [bacterium]|nr:LPS export ABC transporter periplasmic protein LptC [bacterium]
MIPIGRREQQGFVRTVVIFMVALAVVSCSDDGGPGGSSDGGAVPDQEISSFTLTQTNDGRPVWSLKSELALVFEDADRVETTRPRVEFFDENGESRSVLRARNGLLRRRTNDMEVFGSVVLRAKDGTVLETEHLLWDERRGKIFTERPVRVTRDGDVMTGTGAEASPDLGNLRILADFKAYVRSADGELVEEE